MESEKESNLEIVYPEIEKQSEKSLLEDIEDLFSSNEDIEFQRWM